MKIIRNESEVIKNFEIESGLPVPSRTKMSLDKISVVDFESCLQNGLNELRVPGQYQAIAGIAALPPKTEWAVEGNKYRFLRDLQQIHIPENTCRDTFIETFRCFAQTLAHKRIAVELSGGLDSSLFAELLLHVGMEPVFVGFSSDRYEFRTERVIQEYYKKRFPYNSYLLRYEDCPSFARLDEVPYHHFPTSSTHFFHRHNTVAKFASENNIDIVFSGEAGDQLLGHKLPPLSSHNILPQGYAAWCLSEMWSDQFVYRPYNVKYLSGFAESSISSCLFSLRVSEEEDYPKWWARRMFSDLLPDMLSSYAYCAAHDGWVVTGLKENLTTIEMLAAQAADKISHPLLSSEVIVDMIYNYGCLGPRERAKFLSILSFIVWVNSLQKD